MGAAESRRGSRPAKRCSFRAADRSRSRWIPARSADSRAAERLDDALLHPRGLGELCVLGLIVERAFEHRDEAFEGSEVIVLYCGGDDLLHAVVARDER